jgi:transmembrane 9 superfamily protein 3
LGDEYGWKQVHGDVFRPSSHATFFSALIGSGYHVTVVTLSVILLTIVGELYTELFIILGTCCHVINSLFILFNYFLFRRGSLVSTGIFVYADTSPVNGYFGGSLYARMGGKRWIRQMLVSAFLVPLVVCGTEFFINFIAIYYHASRAIPFGSMVRLCSTGTCFISMKHIFFWICLMYRWRSRAFVVLLFCP